MKAIRESDWKRLRDLKPVALERFCDRVLLEIDQARSDAASSSHQRYLAIYDLIRERDEELGYIFDGLSRSSAIGKLLLMHRTGLLTEDEVAGFSEDMKDAIARSQNC
jgi:hypothetical protein